MPDMLVLKCSYHSLMLLIDLLLLYYVWRSRYTPPTRFFLLCCCGGFAAIFLALATNGIHGNLAVHGLAWHGSFFLCASAFLMYREKIDGKPRRWFPSLTLVFGCIVFGVAVDALLIEPTALVVKETTIMTPKITKPITIVFASDFQADRVGHYERRTMNKIKEQNADLILFGGDYTQARAGELEKVLLDWNQLLREIDLQASLGIYAVQGNFDRSGWEDMFEGTAIVPQEQTLTKTIGEIRVTFLSLEMSRPGITIPDAEQEGKFRIMVAHRPNYAMVAQDADLLLAGHTHGGQVQIPFLGLPIVTASQDLPRSWATGMTTMSNGATLIVSHGTGLERGIAPRIRFYCRPDFWVIRLVPDRI